MRITAIIQARMGSTRLPAKVLKDIAGQSMLARVCRRACRAATIDEVVVATTAEPADQVIVDECGRLGVACFRGSEDDVLDRYHHASQRHGADAVVRITADCPLIDPDVVDRVVRCFLTARPDYASNTLTRTWPRGLDTEVFSTDALDRAHREAAESYERVHVTPYFYQHPERFRLLPVTCGEDLGELRWTVDSAEDLQFVRAIYERLGDNAFSWREALQVLAADPGIVRLNEHVRQKDLIEA